MKLNYSRLTSRGIRNQTIVITSDGLLHIIIIIHFGALRFLPSKQDAKVENRRAEKRFGKATCRKPARNTSLVEYISAQKTLTKSFEQTDLVLGGFCYN